MAKDYGMEIDKIKAAVPAEEIAKDLAVNKAIDLVKESAVITEVKEKKATAKKTTAKKEDGEKKPAAKKTTAKKTTTKKADTKEAE